ncbi:metal ABC transporter permease [Bacillus piscicola]|uniref:metal ABC transporter permease n=1 Tax=Bacillus piscicola TaxID=1632684 RepID=UPI001F088DFA|nr:metal ABC transporter permease [Bacillus piscicola]
MNVEWTFIERGITAAVIVGTMAPLIGTILAVRRSSVVSESLSHVTLTGISAGVLLSQLAGTEINPLYTGFAFSLIGSLVIEKLRQLYPDFQDLAAPIILSAGLGLSALIMSMSKSGYGEWYDYLFGNIVSVTRGDLQFIGFTAGIVILLFFLFFKEIKAVSFDKEYAQVSGIPLSLVNFLFSLLTALVIAMSMKVVGILLVGALVSLPVASALQLSKSFKQLLVWSVVFGEAAVITGVFFSYHFNIATGGMIVVMMSVMLAVVVVWSEKWRFSD